MERMKLERIKNHINKIKSSPFFDKHQAKNSEKLKKRDLQYMDSLSQAIMQIQPQKLHWLIMAFAVCITLFVLWAALTKIDEIARGQGVVIPSGQNQMIQNLEGGIVSEILVRQGQMVSKGDVLLKISNSKSLAMKTSNTIKSQALLARIKRLQTQLSGDEFIIEQLAHDENEKLFLNNEKKLFDSNTKQLNSKIGAIEDKLIQRKSELADAKQQVKYQSSSLGMIQEEISMTEPMVKRGVKSRVEFLQLQRQENDAIQHLNSAKHSIQNLDAQISELKQNLEQVKQEFASKTQEELIAAQTEYKEIQAQLKGLSDQVNRTVVTAPQNGVVKQLFVNTIGGAIQPAEDLIELVPTDDVLLVEVKIKPSDIAFIYYDQEAIVKFSAYDFAIYGGLKAKVVNISPDTITEEKETYYLVRVQTERNYIERAGNELKIIPGMVADVDILTGKKSILDYILKPILKTTQYTFTER
jgi:adhesin transport system membrane fusion protein